jgi:hypothetical protein
VRSVKEMMRRKFVKITSWMMLMSVIQTYVQSVEKLDEMENYGAGE